MVLLAEEKSHFHRNKRRVSASLLSHLSFQLRISVAQWHVCEDPCQHDGPSSAVSRLRLQSSKSHKQDLILTLPQARPGSFRDLQGLFGGTHVHNSSFRLAEKRRRVLVHSGIRTSFRALIEHYEYQPSCKGIDFETGVLDQ